MKKLIFTGLTGFMLAQSAFAGEQAVVSPYCWNNQDIKNTYYRTPADADARFLNDTWYSKTNPYSNTFKPIWDLRYVNPSSRIWDSADHSHLTGLYTKNGNRASSFGTSISRWNDSGSIVQTKCVNGHLAGGAIVNLWDAPNQSIPVAGPQATFSYQLTNNVYPWVNGRNLRIQANLDKPVYYQAKGNTGGSISFIVYMHNKRTNKRFSYVIPLFSYGKGITKDVKAQMDPNTNIAWVTGALRTTKNGQSYATRSQWSNMTLKVNPTQAHNPTKDDGRWPYFYRANISYQNLQKALRDSGLKSSLDAPENWHVTTLGIQYEIEETGGKGSISGSHYGFRADITDAPQ